jgi:hypothetical protein
LYFHLLARDNERTKTTLEDLMFRTLKLLSVATATIMVVAAGGAAFAQLNNAPFSFKNTPDGSAGMSIGGRQAIINEKVLGETPDNLHRAPDGRLLDVTKAPGGSAIASYEGGGFIPGYHGRSFREGNRSMYAGVFNSFFTPSYYNNSYYTDYQTTSVISSWTYAVVAGDMPFSFYTNNSPVDSWTSIVYSGGGY